MRVVLVLGVLLFAALAMPTASAEPNPPECYDRQPVVDGGVVEIWLTRSCQVRVVVNEPTCHVGDLYICP